MKTPRTLLITAALAAPWFAVAEENPPATNDSLVKILMPQIAAADTASQPFTTLPAETSLEPAAAPAATPEPSPTPAPQPIPAFVPGGKILLNFQGASLNDVLNYLSEAAGFVIVQEAPVSGTVNVVSRQPISPEESVDLLNAVLIEKGYIAIRNGRILKIVARKDALKQDLPVETGSDPAQIPKKDNMVTQILPVRYTDAAKLVDNLRPLLASDATISANESSNAVILTETQTNIRRIAQVISALDTSVSTLSSIHVFPLHYADATQMATVLTQLFASNQSTQQQQQGFGGRGGFPFGFGRGGPGGGDGGNTASSGQSQARQAATKVIAVADEQSNSVIVSAPDEVMPTIADIITRTDTSITAVSETRIFQLKHADSTELASILTTLYAPDTTTTNTNQRNRNQGGQGGPPGQQGGQPNPASSVGRSERALLEARVIAVADPRTNSLLVTAGRDTMLEIAQTIGRLDGTDAKQQHIYVQTLENADADNVASILQGMFGNQGSTTSTTQTATSRLNQRSANGASADATDTMNINSSRAGGNSNGR